MGRMPDELRVTIAHNIRACRFKRYPGRGGAKLCAEEFGVSPQQWSPWENGKRTPDEIRLQQLARFFDVTVEFLRTDHQSSPVEPHAESISPNNDLADSGENKNTYVNSANTAPLPNRPNNLIPGIDIPPPPAWQPDPPGSPASFFWLARHYMERLLTNGVRLDKQCLDYNSRSIAAVIIKNPNAIEKASPPYEGDAALL